MLTNRPTRVKYTASHKYAHCERWIPIDRLYRVQPNKSIYIIIVEMETIAMNVQIANEYNYRKCRKKFGPNVSVVWPNIIICWYVCRTQNEEQQLETIVMSTVLTFGIEFGCCLELFSQRSVKKYVMYIFLSYFSFCYLERN